MNHEDNQDRLIEYLYGETAPGEKAAFKAQLEEDPQLSGDLKSYLQLRQLFHEHLPEAKAPRALSEKVLRDLGLKRPWYAGLWQGHWQPALAGAVVLVLTLGISYSWKRLGESPQPARERALAVSTGAVRPLEGRSAQEFSDSLLANGSPSPPLRVPVRRPFAASPFAGRAPMVTLAGYGQPYGQAMVDQPRAELPTAELQHLEMEADMAMAQFHHQQALRLRAMGEFKTAAQNLGRLIAKYPFYPLKFQAMAQRVDCLFRANDLTTAKQELRVLGSVSPKLAFAIEQRWAGGIEY
jgi:hypothetical protein